MRYGIFLVLLWLVASASLAVTVNLAHAYWWAFIPPMGFGTAAAVTLPGVFAAALVGALKALFGIDEG